MAYKINSTLNKFNDKCNGCKYKGIYMCTNSRECNNNDLFINRLGGNKYGK